MMRRHLEMAEESFRAYQKELHAQIDKDAEGMGYDCCDSTEAVTLKRIEEMLTEMGIFEPTEEAPDA